MKIIIYNINSKIRHLKNNIIELYNQNLFYCFPQRL